MPSALLEPVPFPPLECIPRKKWTRAEIDELTRMGWFAGEHYELIDGELIDKKGKGEPHVVAVIVIHSWLASIFGFYRVRKEDPIDVAADDNQRNEPEPDLVVIAAPVQQLGMQKPRPEEILLVIEVAAATLAIDLSTKAELYARAGIPDYWVLDLNRRHMIVHREPVTGKYSSIVIYEENESVAPLAAPESIFRLAAAFGD